VNRKTLAKTIDHAILKPEMTIKELIKECEIAKSCGVFSVCVKPCDVKAACDLLKDSGVLVGTVIGFPHGSTTTAAKVFEAAEAIGSGAKEIDMVINVGRLLSNEYQYVEEDIRKVVEVGHREGILVKVIIETSLLTDALKVTACKLAEKAGADFVKTSTGFNGGGAALEDIKLMREAVSKNVRVKASGGIKTSEFANSLIEAGCERLGTSASKAILESDDTYEGNY
jgi:deoxyribose-phosphate aldolase